MSPKKVLIKKLSNQYKFTRAVDDELLRLELFLGQRKVGSI